METKTNGILSYIINYVLPRVGVISLTPGVRPIKTLANSIGGAIALTQPLKNLLNTRHLALELLSLNLEGTNLSLTITLEQQVSEATIAVFTDNLLLGSDKQLAGTISASNAKFTLASLDLFSV